MYVSVPLKKRLEGPACIEASVNSMDNARSLDAVTNVNDIESSINKFVTLFSKRFGANSNNDGVCFKQLLIAISIFNNSALVGNFNTLGINHGLNLFLFKPFKIGNSFGELCFWSNIVAHLNDGAFMTKFVKVDAKFYADIPAANDSNFFTFDVFFFMTKYIKTHDSFFNARNIWHNLFCADRYNDSIWIEIVNNFRSAFSIEVYNNVLTFTHLTFEIFVEQLHFFLKPHNVRKQCLTAQLVGLFVDNNLMTAFRSSERRFHASNTATNNSNTFYALSWWEIALGQALECKRIGSAMTVIAWMTEQMQLGSQCFATAMIHAIVATQTWTNIVFSTFLGLLDDFRISHSRTCHEYIVSLALCQYFFSNFRRIDSANNANWNMNTRSVLDDFRRISIVCHWEEIAWMLFWTAQRVDTVTAGNVNHISIFLQNQNLLCSVFWQNTAFNFVVTIETELDKQIVANCIANSLQNHHWEATAIFDGTTKFIGTMVGERRKELVEKPAVCHVDHKSVEASDLCPKCILCKKITDAFHIFESSCLNRITVSHISIRAKAWIIRQVNKWAAVQQFCKSQSAISMYGTLQKMELHLVAGFRIKIEHMLMAAINRHFHWQSNS